jgi:outer membrane protein
MKRALGFFVGAVFCLSVFAGAAHAADKLAYVDLGKIFGEYNKTKDYDKVLSDKESVYNTEREKRVTDLKQYDEKLSLLSEKERSAKKDEIQTKLKTFKDFETQKLTDLRKEQDEKMREILKDIQDAVKQYAEKEGYTLVFNDRVLVYQVSNLDISDKIIQIINSKYVKK